MSIFPNHRIAIPRVDAVPISNHACIVQANPIPTYEGLTGESIPIAAPCFMGTDGLLYSAFYDRSSLRDACVLGFSAVNASKGRPLSLYKGKFFYHDAIKPGVPLYLSGDVHGRLTEFCLPNQDWVAMGLTDGQILVR